VKIFGEARGGEAFVLKANANGVAFSPDGKHILAGGREVKVWDARTGTEKTDGEKAQLEQFAPKPITNPVTKEVSPDGKRVVTVTTGRESTPVEPSRPCKVVISDAETGAEKVVLNGLIGQVRAVAWSPDGKRIVTGGGLNASDKIAPGEVRVGRRDRR